MTMSNASGRHPTRTPAVPRVPRSCRRCAAVTLKPSEDLPQPVAELRRLPRGARPLRGVAVRRTRRRERACTGQHRMIGRRCCLLPITTQQAPRARPVRRSRPGLVGQARNRWPWVAMAEHVQPEPKERENQASSAVEVVVPAGPPVLTPSAASALLRILRSARSELRKQR
jgi:hypothetical protein